MEKKHKIVAGSVALVAALGLGVAAVGASTAYFSDTNSGGSISVDMGSIYVDTGTGDELHETDAPDFDFANIEPGQEYTAELTVGNTGENTQDVWIQFDPADLDIMSSVPLFTGFTITVEDEDGQQQEVFHSDDLTQEPIPAHVALVDDLEAGEQVDVAISFELSSELTEQGAWAYEQGATLDYQIVATQDGMHPDGTPAS